jgi:hypothetical protein
MWCALLVLCYNNFQQKCLHINLCNCNNNKLCYKWVFCLIEMRVVLQPTGLELKDGLGAAAGWPYPSVYHPYDAAFAGYPFNG